MPLVFLRTVRRVCVPAACTLGLLAVAATEAAAQLVPGWNTKQFTLERLDADRVRLTREVEVEGEKGSPNEGQKFFADNVEWNTRTGEMTASGNVVLSTPDSRISADSVVFNTRTRLGTFSNASGIASLGERGEEDRSMFGTMEPDVYFYGEIIEKIDVDKYKITRGAFTTCVQPAPRWEIASGSSIVNLHDYAVLTNAVIRVKEVPVFYLPVMYYPIQDDDRATGFLIPTYGRSTYRGQSLSNAFFWAVNRSQDATFFHDWFFSRGQGAGTEYRYIVSPQSAGNFRLYSLKEDETAESPERSSYQVAANITQGLPGGLRGRARVDYFSNITVQQLYNNNIYQQQFSTRSYGGGVSGAWRGLSVSGQYQRTESFFNQNDSFVSGQAPGVTASYSGRRLGSLPVYASVNTDVSQVLWQQRSGDTVADFGLGKFDLLPSIRAPLSTLPFLSLNASFGYRMTHFTESLDTNGRQIEEPVTRKYADMRAEVIGPIFTRVFNPQNGFAERMKHLVEPSVTFQRITDIDNLKQVPTTGSYEYIVGGTTRITYGLTNRLLVRRATPDPATPGAAPERPSQAGPPRELLTVAINQSYYSNPNASPFDQSYGYSQLYRPASNFSTVALTTRAMPAQSVGMDFRMEYDPIATERQLVGFGLNGVLRSRAVDASAGWNRQNYLTANSFTSNNYIQQTTTLRLLGTRVGGTVQFNYDIGRSTMLNQRYIGNYSAQCCGFSVEFQSFNYPSTFVVPQDRRFNFSFTLAGIGSFSNFFGTFGGSSY